MVDEFVPSLNTSFTGRQQTRQIVGGESEQ